VPRNPATESTPMKRILEPELMTEEEQARAYAEADFQETHQLYPELFAAVYPARPSAALVLDLGCGPADVTLRFARANPGYRFHAVDGSKAMLKYARRALRRNARLSARIRLIEGYIPGVRLPERNYDVILSNNLLHHLHEPRVLWQTIRKFSRRGTRVFVTDLFRPDHAAKARAMVRRYSGSEPRILRRDFLNSLLAAFTPMEIRRQLKQEKLDRLTVKTIDDRHLIIYGRM
jgi:SAM-dependent methyltransferase